MGMIVRLYRKAQNKLMLIKIFPRSRSLTMVRILYKFSDNMITSDALILSSDLALMETPIAASCRQGMSLRPSPTMMTPTASSLSRSFWVLFIHSIFMNALCSGWRQLDGIFSAFPSSSTLSRESPDKIWICLRFFISSSITRAAYGLRLEWVLATMTK